MYIAILRGINVSGHHIIKMEALRNSLQALDFQHVKTYIQSGNIIFQSDIRDVLALEQKIKHMILQDFGYEIPCLVIRSNDLKTILNQNPLLTDKNKDQSYFHVTLLSKVPEIQDLSLIVDKKQPDEEIFLIDRAVYLYCPNGYGKTKLTNNFIESKLKVSATTRNWKTLHELLKIASENKD
ncbi:DUF1697 domain-containing protein [Sphingobacterium sp. SRCM116780]|uniref:DUF1697 domain-containing protein n=1 Tax=Sphingobacterium sp. SRCM116780 TaxID=2907623 RepID=UPI001F1AF93B|nr:DUF1697 domain-containing protein [Sphingobacterium sp. SRCM116780]UIR57157.1 DUF1697 domain-containing protein [Sphingobacterium sp. SRCM116780]